MKLLTLAIALATTIPAQSQQRRSYSSCDAFVAEAVERYDWRMHEDDYNQVRIVNANRRVHQGRIFWTYQVMAGYNLQRPGRDNSTYAVVVQKADDCERSPYCTKLFCRINQIQETRKRP